MTSKVKCFVRDCGNSSDSTPGKIFFTVPKGERRRLWLQMARSQCTSLQSSLRCCEDHFNVEKDVENWIQNKVMMESGLKPFPWVLRKDVTPHLFDCQKDRKRSHTLSIRSAVEKRKRMEVLKDISTTDAGRPWSDAGAAALECPVTEPLETNVEPAVPLQVINDASPFVDDLSVNDISVECHVEIHTNLEPAHNTAAALPETVINSTPEHRSEPRKTVRDTQTQTAYPRYRSEHTQTKVAATKESSSQTTQGRVFWHDVYSMEELEKSLNETHLSVATDNASASEYVPSEVTNTSVDTLPDEVKDLHLGVTVATCNMQLMEKYPRVYLGLDKETLFLVPLLQKHTGLDKRNIFVALRKIRLNESSEVLGHIFWLHRSSICRIVNESIPKIARFMATCIKWPSPQIIQSNVPLAFRAHYSTVQSILDCFEVEIEKFSNPLFQSLTWSEYKKRNTIKFLISSTPDGLINFVSSAYGGRATDCNILRDSGYLEVLPRNTLVMADRGFKNVESLISDSGSRLVRPPSVHTEEKTVKKGNSEKVIRETVKMTKKQVRETKVIASLRIVIERVIGRLRNFEMVDHAANFHHDLLSLANNIVVIVCGLSNLQGPLFL